MKKKRVDKPWDVWRKRVLWREERKVSEVLSGEHGCCINRTRDLCDPKVGGFAGDATLGRLNDGDSNVASPVIHSTFLPCVPLPYGTLSVCS